ncbi:MAG: DUF1365 domain-containing protein [Micavibrio aeruginosavorus]|uniref:DUF1365 domain-containing protein n=1 Tax=Micavibrio aeruginosavorus TaxID=349221 RepID=A0A2W5FK16_9BACT|nr:MAG: DUF1365 domain-containing protein [Micavibrio aeruginosavorus]
MDVNPQVLFSKVMHKRFFPKINAFTYGLYYLAIPIENIDSLPLPVDRPGLLSFYRKDHGHRDGGNLKDWISSILQSNNILLDGDIVLMTMPRVLGYVFNPVSFWLCFNKNKDLRAVLCEVNNTFGETHSYLCRHIDGRPIGPEDWLAGDKLFHVSPFLEREGYYKFRFHTATHAFGSWINYFDKDNNLQLATALTGKLQPMTHRALARAFWLYPLVTLKAIFLIHWQAIILLAKGIRYVPKPLQNKEKITLINNIKKL